MVGGFPNFSLAIFTQKQSKRQTQILFHYLINRVINDLDTNSIYTDDTVSTMFYPDFVTLSSRYLILKTPSQGHLRTVCYEIQLIKITRAIRTEYLTEREQKLEPTESTIASYKC